VGEVEGGRKRIEGRRWKVEGDYRVNGL